MVFFLICNNKFVLLVLRITEAERAAEVLLGPYTAEEHAKRHLVVRDRRLNRAYEASVILPERVNPDAGKKKRSRVPEVELGGPIAAQPIRAVHPDDCSGPSRNLKDGEERPVKRSVIDPFEAHADVSSRASSNDGAPSPAKVTEVVVAACAEGASPTKDEDAAIGAGTASHVKKAMGTIRLPRLDGSETSSGGVRQRGDDDKGEGSCNAPTSPEVEIGEYGLLI